MENTALRILRAARPLQGSRSPRVRRPRRSNRLRLPRPCPARRRGDTPALGERRTPRAARGRGQIRARRALSGTPSGGALSVPRTRGCSGRRCSAPARPRGPGGRDGDAGRGAGRERGRGRAAGPRILGGRGRRYGRSLGREA